MKDLLASILSILNSDVMGDEISNALRLFGSGETVCSILRRARGGNRKTKPVKFTFGSQAYHNRIFQGLYLSREWFSNAQNSKCLFTPINTVLEKFM